MCCNSPVESRVGEKELSVHQKATRELKFTKSNQSNKTPHAESERNERQIETNEREGEFNG